ncbi:DUF5047 domain-containing protein [Yinghuangia soli]|uniref:DUF5047 domain-containing protein n=1 Tax=Yinghuangia soli TaxID=2908204 RepID=A0AA41U022_9ACTN|nr:DUF5047 domain-containing protein [Yinghuangia soli]MCF2529378.1 DUF5047 domain-containing protein [Yinghuangia soli]
MRARSPAWDYVIPSCHGIAAEVTSWRSGVQLGAVPLLGGEITYDDTALLRRRLTLSVPNRMPDGRSFDPGDDAAAPLAVYGSRLRVMAGIVHPNGSTELLRHGWYLVTEWERDEAARTVEVTAVDLAQLLDDARHLGTESPPAGSTYAAEFTRLVDGLLPVRIAPGLPDRRIPPGTVWDRERPKNLTELCRAWGARWFIDDDGYATAAPAYSDVTPATPTDVRFVSGRRGTVVNRRRAASRDRLYNAVVATGKAPPESSSYAPSAVATIDSGPIAWDGPYGRKPRFYQSDLLVTNDQCQEAARNILARSSSVSRSEPITAVPDPALELGDVAQVLTGGQSFTGRVSSIKLPLIADGPMEVTVTNQPAQEEES